jgi:hypothetical protein
LAFGEWRIGLGHLQRADLHSAERHRGVELDRGRDAETPGGRGHGGGADFAGQPGGDGVDGLGQGRAQGDLAEVLAGVVARLPLADRDGLVDDGRLGRAAGLHRGQVDEGFEGRTRLPPGHGRAVELALQIVHAADVGAHPALAVERDKRGLFDSLRLGRRHAALERLLGAGLDRQVEGGLDHQVLGRLAHQHPDLIVNPVGEVLRPLVRQHGIDPHLGADRSFALRRGDEAGFDHLVEHGGRAARGAVGGRHRRIAGRALHQPGQQRRLAQGKLRCGLAEVALGRGLDAVGPGAEIDPVQIELEDLLLGEARLQPDRQDQLLGLPAIVLRRRQEEVAGELLGDGRAAAQRAAALAVAHVVDLAAGDAPRIESEVPVVPAVLDGDEGLWDIGRQGVEIDRRRVLAAAHRHQRAGTVEVRHRGLALDLIEARGVRQVGRKDREEGDQEDHPPDAKHEGPVDEALEERAFRARRVTAARGLGFGHGLRRPNRS